MTAARLARQLIATIMLAQGLASGRAFAVETPEIEATVKPEEIFAGESVDYQVEIRHSKNPSAPDLTPLKQDFDVVAAGDESRNQQSTFIINGKVSQQNLFSHVYRYKLTPKNVGLLTIPAVTANVGGKKLTSDSLTISVTAPETQDVVVIELETDHGHVYPTQPFTVTLRVLIQPLPNSSPDRDPLSPLRWQPPHLQFNWLEPPAGLVAEEWTRWLQPLLTTDGMGFTINDVPLRTGFLTERSPAVFSLPKRRETRKGLNGQSIRYFVYELSRTFTPEKTGEFTFGPASIKGQFVTMTTGNNYTAKRTFANTEAITVEVRNMPTPRPATYCGAIGDYKVRASATPTKLRVGDPMTLTIEIERGSHGGSLDMISAPDLSASPQLEEDFDLIDRNPTGRVEGTVKKFAYGLRPKRVNSTIPALTIHTFDPVNETFVPIQTRSIPLEVSEAAHLADSDLIGASPTKATAEIKSRAQGIFQNVTDVKELRDERVSVSQWINATFCVWGAAGMLMLAVTYYRHKSSDASGVRRARARTVAQQRLAEARRAAGAKAQESLRLVRLALIGFVADTRNLIAEGLTTNDVGEQLAAASVSPDVRESYLQLLESIDSAEYGAASSIEPSTAIDAATGLIRQVSVFLERGA